MTPTGQPGSRPITPAQQKLLKRCAADTRRAMDNLLAASPALRRWMQENYQPPAADTASPWVAFRFRWFG